MEGSAQRRRHNQRLFDGRIEKRQLRFPSTSQAWEPPLLVSARLQKTSVPTVRV